MASPEVTAQSSLRTPTSPASNRRRAPSGEHHLQRVNKRAKYSAAACGECKKRKLKCIRPDESEPSCQRCLASGSPCVFLQDPVPASLSNQDVRLPGSRVRNLENEIALLREQVTALSSSSTEATGSHSRFHLDRAAWSLSGAGHRPAYTAAPVARVHDPKEPQFVGYTRSAFSLNIAKTSLARLGIEIDSRTLTSAPHSPRSRSESPEPLPEPPLDVPVVQQPESPRIADPLISLPTEEIIRLLEVFHEEVESVYPFVNSPAMAASVPGIIDYVQDMTRNRRQPRPTPGTLGPKDVWILKMAVACAVVIEARGKNDLSKALVNSAEPDMCRVSHGYIVDLKKLQAVMLMGVYHFHCDEELLAWRTTGLAVRMALEMGLHRKHSLLNNFKRTEDQDKAIRAFWCLYVLDKRWSFGTGLPFALNERDIDPELPKPGKDLEYLRCLISYGQLCSKVWEALPPFGTPTSSIPEDQVRYLEYLVQDWVSSIPSDLQLRHLRLGLTPPSQPRQLHRLRTLLHLRGNHLRTLIRRHHVLSASSVSADMASAELVVDIAKDSIEVLVQLAGTTDIYIRQQAVFNHFLLSALAVILVAVCHAPAMFESCRTTFSHAVDLVKSLSRDSHASRRLWKSIRGLLHGVKVLAQRGAPVPQGHHEDPRERQQSAPKSPPHANDGSAAALSPEIDTTLPDLLDMGNDLMDLFEGFGQQRPGLQSVDAFGSLGLSVQDLQMVGWDPEEISRQLQPLI